MNDRLSKTALAEHVGSGFAVEGAADLVLELVEVENLPGSPEQEESFSLTFCARDRASLPQTTYRLHHAALGEHDVFLVPIREDASGLYLQAVYNRADRG